MDYGKAEGIRKKGLAGLITDNLVEGKSIGSSFGSAISDRTKATFTGIQEKFDPLNIAKKLTGGSNLAPALLGRLTGRKQSTIEHFASKKGKSSRGGLGGVLKNGYAPEGEGMTETLGMIYEELKLADEERKNLYKARKKEEKNAEEREIERNQAIIMALTTRRKKEESERKKTKAKKGEEEGLAVPPKGAPPKGTPPKAPAGPTPKAPTGPAPAPKAPTGPAPAPKAPTGPAPAPKAPTGPAPAPKAPAQVSKKTATSTAAKVAGAAVLGTTVTSAIGASESGGDYNISFGDRFDKKSGKMVNFAKDPKTGKPLNLMTPEEFSGGKKLTEMTLEEVKAFGEYRSQNGAGAGAVGKYQFMPTTLFGRVDKQGKYIPGLVAQLKIPMNTQFSGPVQEQLQELLRTQDVNVLKKAGVPITPGYEYMAHYIGAGGAIAVYNSIKRGENKTVAEVMTDARFPVGNNRELYEIRAIDFEKELQNRLEQKGKLTPHSSADSGEQVSSKSQENKNLKKTTNDLPAPLNVNNTNINQTTNTPAPQKTTPKNDRPAILEKSRG